jgi:hypothetical protein
MLLAAIGAVVHNASIRRVLLAFIGFSLAEWATWIAILVRARYLTRSPASVPFCAAVRLCG